MNQYIRDIAEAIHVDYTEAIGGFSEFPSQDRIAIAYLHPLADKVLEAVKKIIDKTLPSRNDNG